jgi:hypothetical protein
MAGTLCAAERAALMWAQEEVQFGSAWLVRAPDGSSSVWFVVGEYRSLTQPGGCAFCVADFGPSRGRMLPHWFLDAQVLLGLLPVATLKQWYDAHQLCPAA